MRSTTSRLAAALGLLAALATACGGSGTVNAIADAGTSPFDAGPTAGSDAGPAPGSDAGPSSDGGLDGGGIDAGPDGGTPGY